jgi:hypothetical protein
VVNSTIVPGVGVSSHIDGRDMVMCIWDEGVWCVCVISLQKETYSLGFFFGPGLPRGLGMLSEPRPSPLFDPGLGPFVLVFFGVSSVVG